MVDGDVLSCIFGCKGVLYVNDLSTEGLDTDEWRDVFLI